MDLLTNGRGVILVIGTITEQEDGRYYVKEDNCCFLADCNLHTGVTIPSDVRIQKHKYVDGSFIVNEDYQPANAELQSQLDDMSIALAAIMGV